MISLRFYTIVFKDNIKAIWSELAFICIVNWTVFKRILVKLKLRLQTSLSGRLTVSTSQAVLYIFISFCFENRRFCNLYRGLKNSSKHRLFHNPFDSCNVQNTSHNSVEVLVLICYSLASKCNALFIANVFTVWSDKKDNCKTCVGLAHAQYIFMRTARRYLTECVPMSPPHQMHVRCERPVVLGDREQGEIRPARETPDVRPGISVLTLQGVISLTLWKLFTHFYHTRLLYMSTQFLFPPYLYNCIYYAKKNTSFVEGANKTGLNFSHQTVFCVKHLYRFSHSRIQEFFACLANTPFFHKKHWGSEKEIEYEYQKKMWRHKQSSKERDKKRKPYNSYPGWSK